MIFPAALRQRFARAVERGDPRLGLFAGIATSFLVAFAFVRPEWITPAHRLELTALDLAFRWRTSVEESSRIAVVDMDDNTFKKLSWPLKRKYHAQTVFALDRLGARQIVFDVVFKMVVPERDDYDPETGEFRLNENDRALRTAIATSGKVTLAYFLEMEDPLKRLRPQFDRVKAAFAKRIGADPGEVARESGLPEDLLREQFEQAREAAVAALVASRMDRDPGLAFADLKREFLPDYRAGSQQGDLHLVHYAYWLWKARRLMSVKTGVIGVTEVPARARRGVELVPPWFPFLERAAGVGCVNAEADADGVMRRPWASVLHEGAPQPYLGLAAAVRDQGVVAVTELRSDRLLIRGAEGEVEIPLDEEGRILASWAGNRRRKRESTYVHLPFLQLVSYFQNRYEALDLNVRQFILGQEEEDRSDADREYLALSERFRAVIKGERDLDPEAFRGIESRMDAIREEYGAGIEKGIPALEKRLATITAPRIREGVEKLLANSRKQLAALRDHRGQEEDLRKLVRGRICFIGSTSTASGDLHSSPLGPSTPGVDVPVNVANMAITGQAIRRAASWINLVYLLAVGLGVSVAVAHWNTTVSALFTGAVVIVTLAVFGWLFSAASLLVTGAGPVFTALSGFAGVTAFKELVTQRSKRKLQRELEKNTSPELVKILMEHPEILSKPRKMEGTFFFSDVKSFTSISEKMQAEVLFPFINRYLDRMTQALKHRQAYLDKYIGDGIMALFGVPVASADHARHACLAALECQAALVDLNVEFAREGYPELMIRIGLNSGEVSAGYMGGTERSDYSVLGDAVNLAARLEGANKEYGTGIMLSETTLALVRGQFVVRELDRIRVVGKRVPTGIYELVAPAGEPLPFPAGFLEAYEAALAAYRARRWTGAIESFRAALALRPDDKASETYIGRCEAFLASPPPPDWEGVFELTSK